VPAAASFSTFPSLSCVSAIRFPGSAGGITAAATSADRLQTILAGRRYGGRGYAHRIK